MDFIEKIEEANQLKIIFCTKTIIVYYDKLD